MITVKFSGQTQAFQEGTQMIDIVHAMWPQCAREALAVMQGGRVLELAQPLSSDAQLSLITYADEEGRRIYERSLRFVLLLAIQKLYPGQRVRIDYSAGQGVFFRLPGMVISRAQILKIEAEMRRITSEDIAFEKKTWQRDEAAAYFTQQAMDDKVQLLAHRPYNFFTMYRLEDMWEYFYGAMVPSTGYVSVFALRQHYPGAVLQLPDPADPNRPASYENRAKLMSVFAQSQRWCEILGVKNTSDVNTMIEKGEIRQFIRVNEALHDRSIAAVADDIKSKKVRAVLIAGPSSSGKTTFTNRLALHLRVLGLRPALLSLDDFYRDRNTLKPQPDGTLDLEAIDTLDLPLLIDCLERLMAGEEVQLPQFDFPTGKRLRAPRPLSLGEGQPVLVEGIHGLNPLIGQDLPGEMVYRIYVSALTCLNLDDHNRIRTTDVRLLRRIVRDHQFRGTPLESTLDMWPSVRRGEDQWIFPYQEQADCMFNTALHYELPVLKRYAYEMLKGIPAQSPNYLLSRRLLKILHYVSTVDENVLGEIPPLSILREFIGGCTFYDKK